jgi:hypothetical protein
VLTDFDFVYARKEALRRVFSSDNPFDGWSASVPVTDADLTQIRVDVVNSTIEQLRYNKRKHSLDLSEVFSAQRRANIALMDKDIDESEYRRRILSTGQYLYAKMEAI